MKHAIISSAIGILLTTVPLLSMDIESNKITNFLIGFFMISIGWYSEIQKKLYRWIYIVLGVWIAFSLCVDILAQNNFYLWNNLVSGFLLILLSAYFLLTNPGQGIKKYE